MKIQKNIDRTLGIKMKKTKIGIWGHLSVHKFTDGQTIKTQTIYDLLEKYYGKDNITITSTYKWRKRPLRFLFKTITLYIKSENLIILPASNGLKIITRIYNFLQYFTKRNIIYIVVGGSLPIFLSKNKKYIKYINKYRVLLVQSHKQVEELVALGLDNAEHFPNFKNMKPIEKLENLDNVEIKRLCYFSRISYDKGVEYAMDAAKKLWEKHSFTLDIYGQVHSDYEERFNKLLEKHKEYVSYKGLVDFDKTTDVLKKYLCLLFPTFYVGEGHPGAIVDAYLSGLPIIGTDWRFNSEFIIDGFNGYLVPIKNSNKIVEKVMLLYSDKEKLLQMRNNSLLLSKKYNPEQMFKKLATFIVENETNNEVKTKK